MNPPSPRFVYPPLNSSGSTTRLVRLLRGSRIGWRRIDGQRVPYGPHRIQCEIVLHELGDIKEQYAAVSYCWGTNAEERDKSRVISLNDQPFNVSPVVEEILIRLYNSSEDALLWIDAICINQNNEAEKERQIKIMAAIFQRASRVYASLGPHWDLHNEALVPAALLFLREETETAASMSSPAYHQWALSLNDETRAEHQIASVRALLKHPFFRRKWVVQEMAFTSRLVVLAGPQTIQGYAFVRALDTVVSRLAQPSLQKDYERCKPLLKLMGTQQPLVPRSDLASVLHRYRIWEVSKKSDHVFALMNLCASNWRLQVKVDYKLKLRETLIQVACAAMTESSSLDILCYKEHCTQIGRRTSDVPTWVPDWTKALEGNRNLASAALQKRIIPSPPYEPEKDTALRRRLKNECDHFMNDVRYSGCLRVWAHLVATITSISIASTCDTVEIEWHPSVSTKDCNTFSRSNRILLKHYIEELQSRLKEARGEGLEKNDKICVLRGSTGIAMLRPRPGQGPVAQYWLIVARHSQYARFGTVWDVVEAGDCRHIWQDKSQALRSDPLCSLYLQSRLMPPIGRPTMNPPRRFDHWLPALSRIPPFVCEIV